VEAVGNRRRRRAHSARALDVGQAQFLDEQAQRPAIADRMMNGEDKHVIIRRATQQVDAVERSLQQIERLAGNLADHLVPGLVFFDAGANPIVEVPGGTGA